MAAVVAIIGFIVSGEPKDASHPANEIVDWYVDKKIELDALVTHRLRLDQIGEGFEMMKRGESIRSVVVL